MPNGWKQDWLREHSLSPGFGRWIHFVPFLCREAYLHEESNFYGRPVPLLHDDDEMYARVIFKSGSLYFVMMLESDNETMVVPPGLSLEDVVARLEQSYGPPMPFPTIKQNVFCWDALCCWESEVEGTGRNRWAELKARGGEVHPNWLGSEPRNDSWLDCP